MKSHPIKHFITVTKHRNQVIINGFHCGMIFRSSPVQNSSPPADIIKLYLLRSGKKEEKTMVFPSFPSTTPSGTDTTGNIGAISIGEESSQRIFLTNILSNTAAMSFQLRRPTIQNPSKEETDLISSKRQSAATIGRKEVLLSSNGSSKNTKTTDSRT